MCHLLNKLPNSVALAEPMDIAKLLGRSERAVIANIRRFAKAQRRQILRSGTAVSKSSGGTVPDNFLEDPTEGAVRAIALDGMALRVTNVDSTDFRLYVKQPAFFTAELPFLSKAFECYASIRNPLSVLLSWRDCHFPVSQGRAPNAERVSTELRERLDAEGEVLTRQLILLDFFFGRYHRFLPGRVVRYEDVVSSGGRALELIDNRARNLDERLVSRNTRTIGTDPAVRNVAEQLLASENACWNFYTRGDVERLVIPSL
jgi:hypothetical protein